MLSYPTGNMNEWQVLYALYITFQGPWTVLLFVDIIISGRISYMQALQIIHRNDFEWTMYVSTARLACKGLESHIARERG